MLRKVVIGCLLSSCAVIGANASADNQTVSLGYTQSKVPDLKNIRGVNTQYRYEWDSQSVLWSHLRI
jgi:putative virulence related protein PagC